MESPGNLLSLRDIKKTFGGIRALRGVSLTLAAGEVLALVGENGAGKSTLVKILTGIYQPEAGEIEVRGAPTRFEDAHAAGRAGIAAVHQETAMFDALTVAENVYMGRQPMKNGRIDWATMNANAQKILTAIDARFDPKALVKTLGPAERHLVEIARALSQDASVVILDEPTAALSRQEINEFYGIVRRLKSQGKGIIFITHKFDEIFSLADRYIVLRDGASVGEGRIADADEQSLVRLMVGRDLEHVYPTMPAASTTELLRVEGLTHPTEFDNIGFTLNKGEVLGFYGLVGAGRSEAMLSLFGLKEHAQGKITLDGKPLKIRGPEDAINAGIAYVPEERQRQGAILSFSVRENLTLAALCRKLRGLWLRPKDERAMTEQAIASLKIKTDGTEQLVGSLSGGNQQKVVIAKWLGIEPRIIILDEPTKGIDVGAKSAVYQLIADMVSQGLSVILISSELPEVMHLAHRVVVMHRGRQVAEFAGGTASAEEIVAAASGLQPNGAAAHAPAARPERPGSTFSREAAA
jgi:rhamnose transport system ATP-binding protein